MMPVPDLLLLLATTAGVAVAHTLLGPDHYLPFVAMARARRWTRAKTIRITLLCGLGHVGASVALGLIGVGLGLSLANLAAFESFRGSLAAWALILFGLAYAAWGFRVATRSGRHSHWHAHPDGSFHVHDHDHHEGHVHVHERGASAGVTGWSLFTIFVLGPCEPLLPMMLYPAATGGPAQIVAVVAVFTVITLVTMVGAVVVATAGVTRLRPLPGARYAHAVAGLLVSSCGLAIQLAGS
jgi:sulfite exporter TauE/SafE